MHYYIVWLGAMVKKTSKKVFIILFLIFGTIQSSYDPDEETTFARIANQYLPSISRPTLTREEIRSLMDKDNPGPIDKDKIKQLLEEKTAAFKRKKIVFDLFDENQFSKDENKTKQTPECTTNEVLWQDLELFKGQHTGHIHLLGKINRTRTDVGTAMLAKMLAEPTTNIPELKRRQNIIKELVDNEKLFNQLDKVLKGFQEVEAELLSFWDEKVSIDIFGSESYFPFFPLNRFPKTLQNYLLPENIKNKFNQSPNSLTSLSLWNLWMAYDSLKSEARHMVMYKDSSGKSFQSFKANAHITKLLWKHMSAWQKTKQSYKTAGLLRNACSDAGHIVLSAFYMKRTIEDEINKVKALKIAHTKLKNAAMCIGCLTDTKELIESNEALKENIGCLEQVKYLFDGTSSQSQEFDNLLKQLQSSTFAPNASQFLPVLLSRGKILSSAFLMLRTQNNLTDIFQTLGQVDAYLSLAKLYKEGKYCFAEYIENDKPYINLKEFWTPFIEPDKVITNDIELGADQIRNMIVSGPNAGGKSTILKAIMINLLFAQTFAIAPSDKLMFTPFTYLDSYLNITDDIASGNSLFKSEVLRVKSLLETIKNLEPTQFSFVIMDEIFSGTNPIEGQAAGYAIGKHLATIPNNISIIASHFPTLTKLEQDTNFIFKNYQVCVNKKDNGTLSYPFKLKEGKTTQTIAIEIMRTQDFEPQIISDAYAAIKDRNNPIGWQASEADTNSNNA